jgi:hypothetical protein
VSSFGEGGGGPCRSRGHRERSFGKHRAQLVLACEESASGFAVDAASQPGDDGPAVLGESKRWSDRKRGWRCFRCCLAGHSVLATDGVGGVASTRTPPPNGFSMPTSAT